MDKRIRIGGIIAAIIFAILIWVSPSNPPPIPEPVTEYGNEYVQILATNLEKPWAIGFADDKIFVTEKVGRVRVIESGILLDDPLATLRTANVFDGGLLGIAVHPAFDRNHFIYVYYTYEKDGALWNKILRITESNNKLDAAKTIFDKMPGSVYNNGGVIKFGPDGKLYVGTGYVSDSHGPQDIQSLEGKILRLNDDGTIPDDNPFSNSPVFSFGHMNPKGLGWDNAGNLFVTEMGPSKNDEINLVQSGGNYGWPEQECSGNEEFIDPINCYDPAIEPGGIVFYYGDKIKLENSLVLASLRASHLFNLEIDEGGIKSQKSILSGVGRIRDVAVGPDGYLYLITSNTDGKGFPDASDDKLLRIVK
ncbi:PQQ-dependent sugar dehydrogenase [Marine Group I thaumarchaeote]|uniref:PQQ-dependent sugar dehydrogenase n=1 Tax=Marine Group I thaumarchaeote TaxID=2511932 RepID=A0A7K4N207_9ARCH|nr:PQQ-dependent sugar dehydrogenase [Marine Group I thaumarchaeote]